MSVLIEGITLADLDGTKIFNYSEWSIDLATKEATQVTDEWYMQKVDYEPVDDSLTLSQYSEPILVKVTKVPTPHGRLVDLEEVKASLAVEFRNKPDIKQRAIDCVGFCETKIDAEE